MPEFRSACQAFAQNYIDRQMAGFRRLGVVGDWAHPYKTMDKAFEAEEVKVFGEMYRKGYIYKGLKPVYWCPKDETALAEAEIEYQDDPCTSIYVKFALQDDSGKLCQAGKNNLCHHLDDDHLDAARQPGHRPAPAGGVRLVRPRTVSVYLVAEAAGGKDHEGRRRGAL